VQAKLLRSSTFRLALLYMALFGVSVLLLLGYIYWATAGYMARQTDQTIEAEIQGLAEQYRQRGLAGLSLVLAERVSRDPAGSSVYLLTDQDLTPLVGNLDRWPQVAEDEGGWLRFRLQNRGPEGTEEHDARARAFLLRGGLHLLVGRDVRELEATQTLIRDALAWGLAITLALALAGGIAMTGTMMRRLESINQTSRRIMGGDLSLRVPTQGTGDDFDQLADNLNAMLERIAQLMEGVRRVSDSIAHDLRTPLSRLRSRLELAASEPSESTRAQSVIQEAIAEADGILATFNALLRIARIESGARRAGFNEIALAPLVTDVAELYEPLAEDKGLSFSIDLAQDAQVQGDRNLLAQALANLVDNAIRYTASGGAVRLALTARSGRAELTVADSGPGIPPEYRKRVFDRFFRLEGSRSEPGNGLGLSLVDAVAKLHGAAVRLEDNQPGLRAVLSIPISPRPA
jgi:signal transduction histidine kinase